MQGWTALALALRVVQTLPDHLRRERMARGLTQARLAELADLNPRTVQKIEAGDITILVMTLLRLRRRSRV